MRNAVQLQRDSFARASLMRIVDDTATECKYCGAVKKNSRHAETRVVCRTLYNYYWEEDSMYTRVAIHTLPAFCSVGCYRSYNF